MMFANACLRFLTGLDIPGKFESSLFCSLAYLLHSVRNMRDTV